MTTGEDEGTREAGAPAAHARHPGTGHYLLIWAALMGLTILTIITGRMHLGAANLWVALAIAGSKATLVALFFMHLWDDEGVNRLVFGISVLFVAVLALGVVSDFATRLPTALPPGPTIAPAPP